MKLLLHACCGPCSLEPSRLLRAAGHDLTILYANPNIAPREEYERRLATLRTWATSEGIPVIEGAYDPAAWERTAGKVGASALAAACEKTESAGQDAASLPTVPPCLAVDPALRQARCRACYHLRLTECARTAARGGFEGIATTLTVSPYQYTDVIGEELSRCAADAGLSCVFEDFRPFYPEATRRSRALGMYRQNYCGCRFSAEEAAAERDLRKAERAARREAELAAHAEERAAAEAERAQRKAERAAYDAKQAKKRAILKSLREQERESSS